MCHPRPAAFVVLLVVFAGFSAMLPAVGGRRALGQTTLTARPEYDGEGRPGAWEIWPHRVVKRPKIGLVLSGGGARGAAQIGVLKALERHHIPIDFIAAASMGSIVGGLYAGGYTSGEIEHLALATDWDDVLSFSDQAKRSEMFVDQKLARERSFLVVRFQGLEPVIPMAVSTGQRLTDFLSTQTLQGLYHPVPDFDHLKIPFRAVATDLISGKRIVLRDGSLAEALRASATVPLLFDPIEKDSMRLVDGGLVDNIPVDVARDAGCDVVIAIDCTSGLRKPEDLKAPWQTADQIMGIMMQMPNETQLRNADVVITPDIGVHLSSDFSGLDSLIARGDRATEEHMGEILPLLERRTALLAGTDGGEVDQIFNNVVVERAGDAFPDSLWEGIRRQAASGVLHLKEIEADVSALYAVGDFSDAFASVRQDSAGTLVKYTVVPNPLITSVSFNGCKLLSASELDRTCARLAEHPVNDGRVASAFEDVLRAYRARGFSLARIDSTRFDAPTGALRVRVDEGVISAIQVKGGARTEDSFVLGEFPLRPGEVFQIDKARKGITNIHSTTLFDYVYLEVSSVGSLPVVTIRIKERPAQLVRFGFRADNERQVQGSIDIRDENSHGTGTELGLTLSGGERNSAFVLEAKAPRLFGTYLTFSLDGFYKTYNTYLYADAPETEPNRWNRTRVGEYEDIRYGGSLTFGSQLERLGNATMEFTLENVRTKSLGNAQLLEGREQLAILRLGTIVDTKDRYPYPSSGIGLNLSYEFAIQALGSDVGYNAVSIMYEGYGSLGNRLTIHPKFTMGVADKTMPLSEQFRLGGMQSFFGLHEDDRRGRELLLLNTEIRYRLPFRLLFDTYASARYDLGTLSLVPEEIKLSTFTHGVGVELAFDTPVGAVSFALGKSFLFSRTTPKNIVQQGPLLFYFSIGQPL